jgi:hypothetical protein
MAPRFVRSPPWSSSAIVVADTDTDTDTDADTDAAAVSRIRACSTTDRGRRLKS